MNAWPDAARIHAFLAAAWRRLVMRAAINGAAIGLVIATIVVIAGWIAAWPGRAVAGVGAGVLAASTGMAIVRARQRRLLTAVDVERRAPECRNLLVTSDELLRDPSRVRPDIGALVCRHAARAIERLPIARLFPLGRPLARLAGAALIAGLSAAVVTGRPAPPSIRELAGGANFGMSIRRIDVVVTPPAYARRPSVTLHEPADVTALAGSRLHVQIESDAETVLLETLDGRQTLVPSRGTAGGDVVADRDGFLAFQGQSAAGASGPRRLVGLTVDPDRPPVVRIEKPGRDLFLTSIGGRLSVELSADDDLALASLRLKYTTVTGGGEEFAFKDGEVPLQITRESDRRWRATANWDVGVLKLQPGDVVVYRATATDERPGAALAESDAFIIQIVTPDSAVAGGFILDDDPNRYAISQQMIILKTERLIAKRSTLSTEAFADQANEIGVEQRRVRAEFIFMMGGEMEDLTAASAALDETAEAARESELAEGRLQNSGRIDLILATRYMSRAALALATPDTGLALPAEKSALTALQRAFAKSKYLLRPLSTQQQLDLSRRLGGRFANLSRDPRAATIAVESPRVGALRRALAAIAALAAKSAFGADDQARASVAAESLLRLGASTADVRAIAATISAAGASATHDAGAARSTFEQAAMALAAAIRSETRDAPQVDGSDLDRLRGALSDARRRGGFDR